MQGFYTLSIVFIMKHMGSNKIITRTLKVFWLLMLLFDIFLMLETRRIFSPFTIFTIYFLAQYLLYKIHQKLDFIEVTYYEIMKITMTALMCFLMHLETLNNFPLGLLVSVVFLASQVFILNRRRYKLLSGVPVVLALVGMGISDYPFDFIHHLDFVFLSFSLVLISILANTLFTQKLNLQHADLERLKLSEEIYRLFFESQKDGLVIIKRSHILSCNPFAADLLGFSNQRQLLGRNIEGLYDQADQKNDVNMADHIKLALKEGHHDFKWYFKKGQEKILCEVHFNLVFIDKSRLIQGVFRDISAREQAEIALENQKVLDEEKNQALKDKQSVLLSMMEDIESSRRNTDALNTSLAKEMKKAQRLFKEAEAASVAKSDFLANMSHELRTPMNGIIGMNRLLMETSLDEEQRQYAEEVSHSAKALLELVQDVLNYIDIGSGKVIIEEKKFELEGLLNEVIIAHEGECDQKGIRLTYNPTVKTERYFIGDEEKIKKVLYHLLHNAVKFTQSGGVSLKSFHLSEQEHTSFIRLEISDTGIGISEDKQETIFESFAQVESSSTRDFGGRGLGLSICKGLIDLLGGKIGVHSKVDMGSTFWLELELKRVDYQEPLDLLGFSSKTMISLSNTEKDHWYIRKIAKAWQMPYMCFDDQEIFLEKLEEIEGDNDQAIILLDEDFDATYGQGLVERIRHRHNYSQMPIYLMVKPEHSTDMKQKSLLIYDDIISKPINQFDLYDKLLAYRAMPVKASEPDQNLRSLDHVHVLLVMPPSKDLMTLKALLKTLDVRMTSLANFEDLLDHIKSHSYDLIMVAEARQEHAINAIRAYERSMDFEPTPLIGLVKPGGDGGPLEDYDAVCEGPLEVDDLYELMVKWCLEDSATEELAFNPSRLLNLFEDDYSGIDEIISLAKEDIEKNLLEMQVCYEEQKFENLKHIAHKIKGLCANIGAESLAELSYALEQDAGPDLSLQRIEGLKEGFERFLDAVEYYNFKS